MKYSDYIKIFIISNKGKLILIILSIFLYRYTTTFVKVENPHTILKAIPMESDVVYITETKSNDSGKYSFTTISNDKAHIIKDGKLIQYDYPGLYYFTWVIFAIICLFIFFMTIGLDNTNWSTRSKFEDYILNRIHSEKSDCETYLYYIFNNKVIISDNISKYYHIPTITHLMSQAEECIKNPNIFTDYKGTISKQRDNKIDELLD